MAAREVYDNMNENKQKYQEYLEKNEELEYKMEEINKVNNELKLSTLNKLSETEDLQSEVTIFKIHCINNLYSILYNLFVRYQCNYFLKMFIGVISSKSS